MKRKSKKQNFQTLRWLWYSIVFGVGFGLGWVLRRLYSQRLKTGELAATTAQTATTMAAMNGKDELADQLISKQAELARLSADWATQLKAKDDELKATAVAHALHTSADWPAQLAGKESELAQLKQQHARVLAELTTAATTSTAAALRAKDAEKDAEMDALQVQINELNAALQTRDAEQAHLQADQREKDASLKAHQDDLRAALVRIGELEAEIEAMKALRTGQVKSESPSPIQRALDAGVAADADGPINPAALSPIPTGVEVEPTPTVFKLSKTFVAEAAQDAAQDAAQQAGVDVISSGCPQDLSEIAGVSSVFEQRLQDYGIGTYWEVAHASDEVLRAALKLDEAPRKGKGRGGNRVLQVDFEAIRADALRLAHATQTRGQIWTGSKADDFEPIDGIGPVFEQRLFNAGICTYEALMKTSEVRLAEICNSSKRVRTPNYASWIAQAAVLAAAKANTL